MTREEKLYAMNGATLITIADGLGVKVKCNRTRSGLKEAKSAVIERILAAEKAAEEKVHQSEEVYQPEEIPAPAPASDIVHEDEWEDDSYNEKQEKAAESDQTAEKEVNKKKFFEEKNRNKKLLASSVKVLTGQEEKLTAFEKKQAEKYMKENPEIEDIFNGIVNMISE